MKVRDGLAAGFAAVKNHSITLMEAKLRRDFLSGVEDVHMVAGGFQIVKAGDRGSGRDDDMNRRLG